MMLYHPCYTEITEDLTRVLANWSQGFCIQILSGRLGVEEAL